MRKICWAALEKKCIYTHTNKQTKKQIYKISSYYSIGYVIYCITYKLYVVWCQEIQSANLAK